MRNKTHYITYSLLLVYILLNLIFIFYIIIPNFNKKGTTYRINGCDYIVTHSDKCTNPKHKKVK